MANTWRSITQDVTLTTGRDMLDVFNGLLSVRTIRVYRCYIFNNTTFATTGVLTNIQIRRITSAFGGTAVTPTAHDSDNTPLNTNTTSGFGRTVTNTTIFRQVSFHTDESTINVLDMDALFTLVPYAEIWNAGYGDNNIEPITCVAGQAQGVSIQCVGASVVGNADLEIEFTDSAS